MSHEPILNFHNCQHFANFISPIPWLSSQPPVNISPGCFLENWSVYNRPWPCYQCVLATRATNPSSLTRYTVKNQHSRPFPQPTNDWKRKCLNSRLFKSRDLPITPLQGFGDGGLLWLQKEHRHELFLLVSTWCRIWVSSFNSVSIYGLPHNVRDQIKMTEDKGNPASVLKEITMRLGSGWKVHK